MLLLIGIVSIWSAVCVVVVALCITAGRADDALLQAAPQDVAVAALPDDVGFVVTLAEPAPNPAPAARPAARTPVH